MAVEAAKVAKKSSPTIVDEAKSTKSTSVVAMTEVGVVVDWQTDGSVVAGTSKRRTKQSLRENMRKMRQKEKNRGYTW